jgi:hypothetical protein
VDAGAATTCEEEGGKANWTIQAEARKQSLWSDTLMLYFAGGS